MPIGPDGQKRPADVVGCAVAVARIATGEQEDTKIEHPEKREGGRSGGRARAEALSPEQRSEIAQVAARARWSGES